MTTRILLCFHSEEGQTAKVAARIESVLIDKGCEVVTTLADDDPSPRGFDGIVMGDSIHAGQHSRQMRKWASRHAEELREPPVALFQVSLTSSHDDEESVETATQLVRDLTESANLEPDLVGMFAGALVYTKYGWLKRTIMQRINESEGGDTDTSRDFEYTDWDAVEHFATDAATLFTAERSNS